MTKVIKKFVCINCGNPVKDLYKNVIPSVIKAMKCEKCNKQADTYIEFEPLIMLCDSVLLSEPAFRHILYNRCFKLHWKLSLILLILESFTLWRQKRRSDAFLNYYYSVEEVFYLCCLEKVLDNLVLYVVLLLFSIFVVKLHVNIKSSIYLYKAITIASFSKFFLLPVMIWRENTTEHSETIHQILVMGHYLLALILVYTIVSGLSKIRSASVVLPVFLMKEYLCQQLTFFKTEEINDTYN